ncbi:hypothetical protein A33I_09825 [Alkalihalophilus marmarensis DSM 21297]|jgi:hypothetical protein|uniref:Uncharacterized protein n=2 Tax=Alkalihalophilus TaxID=2893060 RepID=U6SQW0_9BACI|nr:hypothetical protein A33I_09825 [Alkalihalophilus marmarensis DSM 21297]
MHDRKKEQDWVTIIGDYEHFRIFYLAQQNNMWLITQHTNVSYKNTFAAIDLINDSILLLADHDAQGFSVLTNHPSYQQKEQIRAMIQD